MHPAAITSADKARAIAERNLSALSPKALSIKAAHYAAIPTREAAILSEACKSVRRQKMQLPKKDNPYVD